jgi:Flp pilus assembly protein TadD
MRQQSCLARLLASATVTAMLASGLAGCQAASMLDVTGSLGTKSATNSETDPHQAAELYGEKFRANPKDVDAALKYGTALRAIGQRAQGGRGVRTRRDPQSWKQVGACQLGSGIS